MRCKPQEAGEGYHVENFRRVDTTFTIAFFRERQNGIWATLNFAAHSSGQMYTQKWEPWVGHRINEPPTKIARFLLEPIILASEGNNLLIGLVVRHRGYLIGVKPRAVNHVSCAKFA